eukprot:TRINITY_DN2357_c0_g1_i2.p1 TRINITY_DN2357_c0_g1~~TRINITY_DN2357_c0_g1_i2.p1  ORF type:complete len:149 (-),score=63.94 TRINITY_DN2357_c0_g1_i2:108-533(-)
MIRRPPRSTHCISSAASDVYKRQAKGSRLQKKGITKPLQKALKEHYKYSRTRNGTANGTETNNSARSSIPFMDKISSGNIQGINSLKKSKTSNVKEKNQSPSKSNGKQGIQKQNSLRYTSLFSKEPNSKTRRGEELVKDKV